MFIMLREQPAGADVGCSVSSALRSVDTSRRCRLFDIFRPSFSRHITQVSAVRYLLLFFQPTYLAGVGCSVSSASRSAYIPQQRRLFGIFRFLFSRHITQASAVRYLPLFVQPTYVLFVLKKAAPSSIVGEAVAWLLYIWRADMLF